MSNSRLVRINELLKRAIAEELYRHFTNSNFDAAAVTVMRVECAPDLRNASVFVSIFGHEKERDDMIAYLNRHRQAVVHSLMKQIKLKYTPRFHFLLDTSLEEGDRILSILSEMERKNRRPPDDGKEEAYERS